LTEINAEYLSRASQAILDGGFLDARAHPARCAPPRVDASIRDERALSC
jgi:hypothetical protein